MSAYHLIKTRVTAKDLIEKSKSINLRLDTGNIYTGACFSCNGGGKSTKFRAFPDGFNCFDCGIKGNLVHLVMQLENLNKKEAFKWLIENYAKEIQYKKSDLRSYEEREKKRKKKHEKRDYRKDSVFFEEIVKRGKKALFEKKGEKTLKYLTEERNYSEEKIKESDFFYMPDIKVAKTFLIKKFPEQKKYINRNLKKTVKDEDINFGLSLSGTYQEVFSLGIPYRDESGNISGLVYRSIEPKGSTVTTYDKDGKGDFIKEHNKRYNSSGGLDKSDLFNVHCNKKKEEVLIVEGYPDATYLSSYDEMDICAVGTGTVSDSHVESIVRAQIKKVILSLDNDEVKDASLSELEKYYRKRKKTIDVLQKLHAENVRTYVIDPEDLVQKDVDEKYRVEKIEGVIKVKELKKHSLDYLLYLIEGGQGILVSKGVPLHEQEGIIIDKFFEFKDNVGENNYSIFKDYFLEKFKSTSLTKRKFNKIEKLVLGENSLSDEGIVHGLNRLEFEVNQKLMPLYNTEQIMERLFPERLHQILKLIFQENKIGKSSIKLNRTQVKRFRKIQDNKFLLSLSDKLISEIVLKSIDAKIIRYHSAVLADIPSVTLQPIDQYFEELEELSTLQKQINK